MCRPVRPEVTMMINVKKMIVAVLALALLAAIVPTTQADSVGVQPYKGLIGADSPLYGAKIFAQNLDVALTFDNTNKMKKQMNYADERLSEMVAADDENNTGAFDAAADQYATLMDCLNQTTRSDDINETEYANLAPLLYHHQQCFYGLMNNSTTPLRIQDRIMYICNQTMKLKNGMPFYYFNNTSYFIPPGQMKKMANNSTFVPPGLANKGYVRPNTTITNGSPAWPWDQIQYQFKNSTMPKVTFTPKDSHDNGNGNGNGNGNANGHNK